MLFKNKITRASVQMHFSARLVAIIFAALCCLCVSCSPVKTAQIKSNPGPNEPEFLEYVLDLKEKYKDNPNKLDLLLLIKKLENSAVDFYYSVGSNELAAGNFVKAKEYLNKGLAIVSDHPKLREKLQHVENVEQALALYRDAQGLREAGRIEQSLQLIQQAEGMDSDSQEIHLFKRKVENDYRIYRRSLFKVDMKFNELSIKDAYDFVAKSFGINIVYDDSVKDTKTTLDLDDVPLVNAIELLSKISHNGYNVMDSNTLIIFADTKQNQQAFKNVRVQSFALDTISAKDMAGILKSVLGIKDITINESTNRLIISASNQELLQIAKIIRDNDVSPGEVVLNVEILEVNLNDAQRLGINFGSYQLSTATPSIPITGSILDSYKSVTTLNIPSVSLDAFKQAVAAKSLAQPSIRVLDREKAKIHIGDRVPLRKSSILDATGQTRTTFEYQEIGIKFNVEANIHATDSVTVKISLEVSSLGENLGTPNEQAFRIGTRNADTTMLINNGETVILGGLLRDEGRSTYSGIYGLTHVPIINRLTGGKDESLSQTDLLLTVTPQIIRNGSSKSADASSKYVGDYYEFSQPSELDKLKLTRPKQPVAALGAVQNSDLKVVINQTNMKGKSGDPTLEDGLIGSNDTASVAPQSERIAKEPTVLAFSDEQYSGTMDRTQNLVLQIKQSNAKRLKINIKVNPHIIEPLGCTLNSSLWNIVGEAELEDGVLQVSLERNQKLPPESQENSALKNLLEIQIKPKRRGTSFVIGQFEASPAVENAGRFTKLAPISSMYKVE